MFSQTSLRNIQELDSTITISKKQFQYATKALIDLKATKIENYLFNERIRNKDISIAFYEKLYKKCNQTDSLNSILLLNKNKEIEITSNLLKEEIRERKLQKGQKIGLAVSLPVAAVLSFILGFYLSK